jgi:branched-chain amino acid transport system ATP-binding protein
MLLIEGKNITKRFGGLTALNDVNFHINKGEILGLIGPNGAGKTTLVNIISGFYPPDVGEIRFKNIPITSLKPHQISRLGIARTFQLIKLFENMTVEENVLVGSIFGTRRIGRERKDCFLTAENTISLIGLSELKNDLVDNLTIQDRKRLELAKALAMGPELILLDEVMAGLTHAEIIDLINVIRKLNEMDLTILIIEHVMKAIMELSHRIIVLHHGKKIADNKPENIVNDERVIEAYLGRKYASKRRINN